MTAADHTPSPATDGLLTEHDRDDLLLGHHDGLCPEGPDCRSRWLHAQSPTIYASLTPALLATFEGILADRIARAILAAHPGRGDAAVSGPSERDEIAAVLAGHQRKHDWRGSCLCGNWPPLDHSMSWPDHLADALADILAERDRRTAAKTLREAASKPIPDGFMNVKRWLRDMADRIEEPQ